MPYYWQALSRENNKDFRDPEEEGFKTIRKLPFRESFCESFREFFFGQIFEVLFWGALRGIYTRKLGAEFLLSKI
jgi:hypothetical protein